MAPGATEQPQLAGRDELTKRAIPHMELDNGTATAPKLSTSRETEQTSISKPAQERFAVRGNAIITGGTGTLGLAATRALLQHGASGIALFDMDVSKSDNVIRELRSDFPNAKIEARSVDVTDENGVQEAVDATSASLGSIDTLCCFAGIVGCVNAIDMPAAQFRKLLDINTVGAFICAQSCAKHMIKQGTGGSIMMTASISAHRVNYPQPQAAYNVSKAAVVSLKSSLAAEWARYGIRVNSISPGYMDTILNAGDGIAEARQIWADRNPSGRMGNPEEVTGIVVMLASNAGTYFNGSDLVVDGGGIVF